MITLNTIKQSRSDRSKETNTFPYEKLSFYNPTLAEMVANPACMIPSLRQPNYDEGNDVEEVPSRWNDDVQSHLLELTTQHDTDKVSLTQDTPPASQGDPEPEPDGEA